MLAVRIYSNANELRLRYVKRELSARKFASRWEFRLAFEMHLIRKSNLKKTYMVTPYKTTGLLYNSEALVGKTTFNKAPYAQRRHDMKGNYAIIPVSKENHWVKDSFAQMRIRKVILEREALTRINEGSY